MFINMSPNSTSVLCKKKKEKKKKKRKEKKTLLTRYSVTNLNPRLGRMAREDLDPAVSS